MLRSVPIAMQINDTRLLLLLAVSPADFIVEMLYGNGSCRCSLFYSLSLCSVRLQSFSLTLK